MHRVWICLTILSLAACGPGNTPAPTDANTQRTVPTVPAPAYTEPVEIITLDNAAEVQYLGRLDSAVPGGTIFASAISLDGVRIAGINNEQTIIWDLLTGDRVAEARRFESTDVFFSPDKTEVYVVTDGLVRALNGETGTLIDTTAAQTQFSGALDYYPLEGWLAIGNEPGIIRVWDMLERRSMVTITTGQSQLRDLAFSVDGTQLAVSAAGAPVTVWNWEAREELVRFDTDGLTIRMSFSPDGTQLAISTNNEIEIWSIDEASRLHTLQTGEGGSIDTLLYSPTGRYLVNSGSSESMTVWDPDSGVLIATLPEVGNNPTAAAFSPDGDLLLTSVFQGPVNLWDMTQLTEEGLGRAELDVEADIIDVAWTADGRTLALFGANGSIYIWGIPSA